jgi:hypothetical protein
MTLTHLHGSVESQEGLQGIEDELNPASKTRSGEGVLDVPKRFIGYRHVWVI